LGPEYPATQEHDCSLQATKPRQSSLEMILEHWILHFVPIEPAGQTVNKYLQQSLYESFFYYDIDEI
jgi:hypothetical protein